MKTGPDRPSDGLCIHRCREDFLSFHSPNGISKDFRLSVPIVDGTAGIPIHMSFHVRDVA